MWHRLKNHPLFSLIGVAFLAIILMIPWPADTLVRGLLSWSAPQTLHLTHWKQAWINPARGIIFDDFEIRHPLLTVRMEHLFLRFQWERLITLQTRITHLKTPRASLTLKTHPQQTWALAFPTEWHLETLHHLLDSLQTVIARQGIDIHLDTLEFLAPSDTLTAQDLQISLYPRQASWQAEISSGPWSYSNWPLPTSLQGTLELLPQKAKCPSFEACLYSGCLELSEGELQYPSQSSNKQQLSKCKLRIKKIPVEPMERLFLPPKAHWHGKAEGQMQWSGQIIQPASWNAQGWLRIENMQIAHWSFQQEGFLTTFAPPLTQPLTFSHLSIPHFRVQNNQVLLDTVWMVSSDLTLKAQGKWSFPDQIQLQISGALSPSLEQQLPKLTRLALPHDSLGTALFKASLYGPLSQLSISPHGSHYGAAFKNFFNFKR